MADNEEGTPEADVSELAERFLGDRALFTVDALETAAGLVVIVAWVAGAITTNTTFGQAAVAAALVMVFGDTGFKMLRKRAGL